MKICVFGASSDALAKPYLDDARELGRLLAREGHGLVFGGGARGLMGACAEGAAELGGEIIGVAPRFFDEPGILFSGCSRFVFTETMAERKAAMAEESQAILMERAAEDRFLSRRCFALYGLCATPGEALRHVLSERAPEGGLGKLTEYSP